jgi:hypothetical protein
VLKGEIKGVERLDAARATTRPSPKTSSLETADAVVFFPATVVSSGAPMTSSSLSVGNISDDVVKEEEGTDDVGSERLFRWRRNREVRGGRLRLGRGAERDARRHKRRRLVLVAERKSPLLILIELVRSGSFGRAPARHVHVGGALSGFEP